MEQENHVHGESEDSDDSNAISPTEIVLFLVRSARRHRRFGIICGASVALVGVLVSLMIPPKYEARTRILASQSAAIAAALSNPNRPTNGNNVDAFAGSTEIMMEKHNLVWLVKRTDLLHKWKSARSMPLRLKDDFIRTLKGEVSEENQTTALAELLGTQMIVYHDNSVLNIQIYWRDADSTFLLAQVAQSRFLELWKTQELSAINAAISINEEEVKRCADGIDLALSELIRVRQKVREASVASSDNLASDDKTHSRKAFVRSSNGSAKSSDSPAEPDKKLAVRLGEIRQQIHDLEVPWQRRLTELKFQLSDLRGTYGPEHPTVIQQESKIKVASQPPPELVALQDRERQILAETERKSVDVSRSQAATTLTEVRPAPAPSETRLISANGALLIAEREDDPVIAPAKANLTSAIQRYSEVTKRLETARLEHVSAQVALQYRYVVVEEPEWPRKPQKPNRPVMLIGSIGAGLLVAFLIGAIRDYLSGRVFEAWQVRSLGLPVLGEVSSGHTPDHRNSNRG